MPTIPGPVDDSGNIIVPAEGGVIIPIREQTNATPPVPIDISAVPMRFLVKGRLDKMLVTNPSEPLGKRLIITETEADSLSVKPHNFQLLDTTDVNLPVALWIGKIRRGE